MTFLPEALWFNEYCLNPMALQPVGHDLGGKFWAI